MLRNLLTLAMTTIATAASAADPALTIYRSDSDALFDSGDHPVADGHAVVHEQRALQLAGGAQTLIIDGLPSLLDAEAVAIDLGSAARVLGQRVMSAGDSLLSSHRGERVQVSAVDGRMLADGVLVSIDNGGLGVRANDGRIAYIRDYARVEFPEGAGMPGSSLHLALDGKAGATTAQLTYPTAGLGWRAAYSAQLRDDGSCHLRLDALASIANRSGRNYDAATLKLVAGTPNFAGYDRGPRMMAMKAAAAPAPEAMPEQSSLGDYRSYAIDGRLDLPDASVTQVPLHASRDLDCERRWVFEHGGAWFPPKPMLAPDNSGPGTGPVQSQLSFNAADNLPAGTLRVLARDRDGRSELLGESRIGDTAKGRKVDLTLGIAFDLAATRERTSFDVDKATREMREGFRITLANSGEVARTVTVREHPNRWRAWTLASSSHKPERQSPDLLEFRIAVPAGGEATLDHVVRYTWTPADE
jgi:hypothetical protein